MLLLLGVCALAYMKHPAFAAEAAPIHSAINAIDSPYVQKQMTVPIALRFGLALRSSSSVTSRIISSSVSRPVFFLADTSTNTVWPPQSSGIRPSSVSWRLTVSGFAPGLSILFTATMIFTFAALA